MKKTSVALFLALVCQYGFGKCAQIYYDRVPTEPNQNYGRTHALYLQNLVSHFPRVQQYIIPIEKYEAGQLNRCEASLYISTYYGNKIPKAFFDDYKTTTRNVYWAGYNFEQLGADTLKSLFGVEINGIATLDWDNLDAHRAPGFFRYFEYKGETFEKYAKVMDPKRFDGAPEIYRLNPVAPVQAELQILSTARHSVSGEKTPYAIRAKNRWYIADGPFSYVTESDRFLITADILFDVLGEKAQHANARPALIRFEDIHAELPMWQIEGLVNAATEEKIPYAISLIPAFRDPYKVLIDDDEPTSIDLHEDLEFVEFLQEAVKGNGSIIFHGATHQYDDAKNPSGVSGDDYEFWDTANFRPVNKDSVPWVLNRIEWAYNMMKIQKLKPVAWLTPHYAGSALDEVMFGQMFQWTVGRALYVPYEKKQSKVLPDALTFDKSGVRGAQGRARYFSDLSVKSIGNSYGGQLFPYEIHGDSFGRRVIPENVGYLQPPAPNGENHGDSIMVDDLIRIMKRNLVIRDAWASFFVHPYLLGTKEDEGLGEFEGDNREIRRLIAAAKKMGYQFVNLKQWTKKNLKQKRSEPIEVFMQ